MVFNSLTFVVFFALVLFSPVELWGTVRIPKEVHGMLEKGAVPVG